MFNRDHNCTEGQTAMAFAAWLLDQPDQTPHNERWAAFCDGMNFKNSNYFITARLYFDPCRWTEMLFDELDLSPLLEVNVALVLSETNDDWLTVRFLFKDFPAVGAKESTNTQILRNLMRSTRFDEINNITVVAF